MSNAVTPITIVDSSLNFQNNNINDNKIIKINEIPSVSIEQESTTHHDKNNNKEDEEEEGEGEEEEKQVLKNEDKGKL
jgi:hypothetical protein